MSWSQLLFVLDAILRTRASTPPERSVLVAVTGIDGCGKGLVTARVVAALRSRGVRAVALHVDGWLNLPSTRFDPSNPAEHFYLHAIRFEEMFARLVLPLREQRAVRVVVDHAEETATEYRSRAYELDDVDVVVLEGIFLLKRAFQAHYDLSIWIDCSFETALQRAVARSQEGLPPEETVHAYRTIYFPAQEIHFRRDDPRSSATLVVNNDERSGPVNWAE